MNRTFDSNGPDVKIRGTAAHIYEKYQALARDAHVAGDRVSAENLLQHAEHYYRILNAYQASQAANGGFNGGSRPAAPQGDGPQPDAAQGRPRPGMPSEERAETIDRTPPDDGEDSEDFRA